MLTKRKVIILVLFATAIYFPIFLHLDHNALFRWDESRNAVAALEMLENGNYLRKFHMGAPDSWDTKPPMLIWLQAICMKIVGYNELAVRLPSALAALSTVALLLWFFIKHLKDFWGGIFSGLVLLTSSGYIRLHVARTGDNDALLLLFLTAGLIFYYLFLFGPPEKQKKYLSIFTLSFIAGVLTKSIAGLYFGPGLLLFTILSGKLKFALTNKFFWSSVLSFFIGVGGYYSLAEYYYPGYLQLIWDSELFPRFFNSSDAYSYNQMPEPYHFTKVLFREEFKYYAWFLPFGLIFLTLKNNRQQLKFLLAPLLTALTFHVIISNGTYNAWYNAPIFPLLAIMTGMGLSLIFESIKTHLNLSNARFILFAGAFVLGIFAFPYREILLEKVYFHERTKGYEHYGAYLKHLKEKRPNLKEIHLYSEVKNSHVLFYWTVYNKCYDYQITNCGTSTNVGSCPNHSKARQGDHVMVCSDNIKAALKDHFNSKIIDHYKNCELHLVEKIKTLPKEGEKQ